MGHFIRGFADALSLITPQQTSFLTLLTFIIQPQGEFTSSQDSIHSALNTYITQQLSCRSQRTGTWEGQRGVGAEELNPTPRKFPYKMRKYKAPLYPPSKFRL